MGHLQEPQCLLYVLQLCQARYTLSTCVYLACAALIAGQNPEYVFCLAMVTKEFVELHFKCTQQIPRAGLLRQLCRPARAKQRHAVPVCCMRIV